MKSFACLLFIFFVMNERVESRTSSILEDEKLEVEGNFYRSRVNNFCVDEISDLLLHQRICFPFFTFQNEKFIFETPSMNSVIITRAAAPLITKIYKRTPCTMIEGNWLTQRLSYS